jgi:hypothetical protein
MYHHDAITGTSSPNAERHWTDMIFRSDMDLNLIQFELVEKLGRLQSMNSRIELKENSPRRWNNIRTN